MPGFTDELVLIPSGEFLMGSDSEGDHSPAHKVYLDAFYIDRYQVTNARYLRFCEATGHRLPFFWGMAGFRCGPGYPNHPVVGVSWREAAAYAAWCDKRLPTEAEWEYAARGGLAGLSYPNGDTITPADGNHTKSDSRGPVPVGSYPPNAFGLYDMQGNVVEWVADYYAPDYYAFSPPANPPGPVFGRFRVIRGGGWHSGPYCNRVYYRNALPENWLDFNVGFRCARDVEAPPPPVAGRTTAGMPATKVAPNGKQASRPPKGPLDRVVVQNVNVPGRTAAVDAAKYEAMRRALLEVLPRQAPGLTQAEMLAALVEHLPDELFPQGAKAGWWAKTVQLDLEAKGLVLREPTKPLRWHRS